MEADAGVKGGNLGRIALCAARKAGESATELEVATSPGPGSIPRSPESSRERSQPRRVLARQVEGGDDLEFAARARSEREIDIRWDLFGAQL